MYVRMFVRMYVYVRMYVCLCVCMYADTTCLHYSLYCLTQHTAVNCVSVCHTVWQQMLVAIDLNQTTKDTVIIKTRYIKYQLQLPN